MGIETHFFKRSLTAQIRDDKHRDLVDHSVRLEVQHHFRDRTPAAAGLEFRQDGQPLRFKTGKEAIRE